MEYCSLNVVHYGNNEPECDRMTKSPLTDVPDGATIVELL